VIPSRTHGQQLAASALFEITLTNSEEQPQISGGFLFAVSGGDDT